MLRVKIFKMNPTYTDLLESKINEFLDTPGKEVKHILQTQSIEYGSNTSSAVLVISIFYTEQV